MPQDWLSKTHVDVTLELDSKARLYIIKGPPDQIAWNKTDVEGISQPS